MYFQKFLKRLKKKSRSKDNNLIYYYRLFASISKNLVLEQKLDLYSQYQQFLQRLSKKIVMKIFYQYDIDLEDDDSLDFGNLLEKLLILVKRKKYLADFIKDKETDLTNKYKSLKKISTALKISTPFISLTPPTQFQFVQSAVQKNISVVQIYTLQIKKAKTDEMNLGANNCMLTFDLTKNFYKDLVTLFSNLKPGNKSGNFMQILLLLLSYLTIQFALKDTYIRQIIAAKELPENLIIHLVLKLELKKRPASYQKKDLLGLMV